MINFTRDKELMELSKRMFTILSLVEKSRVPAICGFAHKLTSCLAIICLFVLFIILCIDANFRVVSVCCTYMLIVPIVALERASLWASCEWPSFEGDLCLFDARFMHQPITVQEIGG